MRFSADVAPGRGAGLEAQEKALLPHNPGRPLTYFCLNLFQGTIHWSRHFYPTVGVYGNVERFSLRKVKIKINAYATVLHEISHQA
jgi:hypothetical protein